ncbi:MAG: nucleotidyl transferase AbiEii/AbiGii toxin family protein [Candidatus Omnitrophica bacterium]|nr:nucleotidyl transferase AbiEii/AbiGii toxin family protein [Candidatus Omnitrophota bacterium]
MLNMEHIESFYPEHLRAFKKNILREYLQYKILDLIYGGKYANLLSFMGGTAIHIIHGINRFSEDLDFDNMSMSDDDFEDMVSKAKRSLELEGYVLETKVTLKGAWSAQFRFKDILFDEKISPHRGEVLLIKVDAEPQNYEYSPEKKMINKFDIFSRINVVPVSTLLAQKISAIFFRKRAMGRDFYDAIYLFSKTEPDMQYLKIKAGIENMDELKKKLLEKCRTLDMGLLAGDLKEFLFNSKDAERVIYFEDFIRNY